MIYNRFGLIASFVIMVTGVPAIAQTQVTCNFKTFAVPSFTGTRPAGINRYGNVVGSVFQEFGDAPPEQISTAFIRFADGSVKLLKPPGTSSTDSASFSKRNALGATVGSSTGFGAFVFFNGSWQKVFGPNGSTAGVSGINLYGSIVGTYLVARNGPVRGFKLKDGHYTLISFPGSVETEPTAISDTGVIVGNYGAPDGAGHGFILKNGVYTRFDDPLSVNPGSGIQTQLADINASGAMVGSYFTGTGFKSFLFRNGVFKDIAVPGASSTTVTGINGFGSITGIVTSLQGKEAGFIGTSCH